MPRPARSERSRCTSAFVPTSMPRVGSSTMRSFGSVASHLARTTFCWLPPERVATASPASAGLHLEALRPLGGDGAFAAAVDEAEPGQRVAQGQRRVAGDREVHDEALLAPVLGNEPHAGVDGGLRIPRTQRPAEQLDAAPVVAVDAEHGPRDLGATGADESGEGDDLAGAHLEVRSLNTPALESPVTLSTASPISASTLGKSCAMSRPTISRTMTGAVTAAVSWVAM